MCAIDLDMLVTYNPSYLHDSDSLDDAARAFGSYEFHHLPVVDGQRRLVGVVSDGDLLRALVAYRVASESNSDRRPEAPVVSDFMTRPVLTATRRDTAAAVVERMLEAGIHSLPLVEGGRLEGIITSTDVIREFSYCGDELTRAAVGEYVEEVEEPIEAGASLTEAKAHLQACGSLYSVVIHGDCPVGIVSRREIGKTKTRHSLDFGQDLQGEPNVSQAALPLVSVAPASTLGEAAGLMCERAVGAVAVTRGTHGLVGLLTEDTILTEIVRAASAVEK